MKSDRDCVKVTFTLIIYIHHLYKSAIKYVHYLSRDWYSIGISNHMISYHKDMVSKPDISYYYNINIDMLNKYLY